MADNPFWQYWYFHLPNYVLAVLLYTLIGRFLLSFVMLPDSANYIWRFFRRLTDPVMVAAGFITPGFISPFFLPLIGAFWLLILRHALFLALYAAGAAPETMLPAPGTAP
jgi:YggT family protein